MMQLVGYSVWEQSGSRDCINKEDATRGIEYAREDFRNGVLINTWRELSAGDRKFLKAMLLDEDSSTLTDIAARLGKTTGYASTYKKRLEQAGVIEQRVDDRLEFALPAMREYTEEQ